MLRIARPPDKFMPADSGRYPDHQLSPMIEPRAVEYFLQNADRVNSDMVYIPIQWTAYHKSHHYGQYIADLQYYIEALVEQNPRMKFFTIVQYDESYTTMYKS